MDQQLIDKVLAQIVSDVEAGDLSAIEELIKFLDERYLRSFLSEEEA